MKPLAWIALSLATALAAQEPLNPDQVAEQRRLAQRALEHNESQVERLIDMRLRHDLGLLPSLDDDVVRVQRSTSSRDMDRMRSELQDIQARNTVLAGEYDKVRRMVADLNRKARESAAEPDPGQFVPVPSPGARVSSNGANARRNPSRPNQSRLNQGSRMPAAPAGESQASKVEPSDLGSLALDPLRAQIHGSKDHQRVAQSLFKAGQALMDRAVSLRAQGRVEAARELDDRGRERLLRAVDELQPLLQEKQPPFVSLFYLGRCRELLFRYSQRHEGLSLEASRRAFNQRAQEVRDPFLQISARDVSKGGESGDVETLGPWGQAAKTAMEHFRWMNINSRYDATAKIEALTWPGADQR
ncbi:MAG: hypothetical protein ACE37K_18555 [Planctomycetota bacterium]